MRVALLTLPRKECSPQNRLNAQDIEIVACDQINLDWLRMVPNVCKHGFGCSSSRCHVHKHIGQRPEIKKVRVRDIECADSPFPCAVDANQLIQILHARQSSEEKRVRQTENRGVRPDAESEREHGHGGEAGVLQQLAEGVFQIVHVLWSVVRQSSKSQVLNSK